MESVAICEIDEKDMGTLGLEPGQNVKVKSNFGEVVLKAVKAKEPNPGIIFVPCGPWANLLIGSKSDGTGMPLFKSIEVEVEPAPSEKVLNLRELLKKAYGGKID
jgi:formylmethanofuran dehydrogenase subunit D